MTQAELAARIGVTQGAVGHWEVGRTVPMGAARILLCKYLGLTRDELERGFQHGEIAA